jgi:hypothetical protein
MAAEEAEVQAQHCERRQGHWLPIDQAKRKES